MRIPILLALLVIILLPRDLDGLAAQIGQTYDTASATVGAFFAPDDTVQVAGLDD